MVGVVAQAGRSGRAGLGWMDVMDGQVGMVGWELCLDYCLPPTLVFFRFGFCNCEGRAGIIVETRSAWRLILLTGTTA